MSTRKPTVDGMDDTDDQDGVLEEEIAVEKDLTLHVKDASEVALGKTDPANDGYVEDEGK